MTANLHEKEDRKEMAIDNRQEACVYRIKVKGVVPDSWSGRLKGMNIQVDRSGGTGPTTTLEGPLLEKEALMSVLNFLYARHYPLVSVGLKIFDPERCTETLKRRNKK